MQIASGFLGTADTVEGFVTTDKETVNTEEETSNAVDRNVFIGPPLHPASPHSMLVTPKTPHISEPSSFPTCLEQLSRSPAFSLNSSNSQSNSLSEVKVKVESVDYFGAGTGFSFSFLIIIQTSLYPSSGARSMQEAEVCWFQLGQLKTESGDNEGAGIRNVDTPDEKPHSHPHVPQSRDKVKCDECGKYLSKYALLNHKRIVHRGEKPFCCKIDDCKERFHLHSKLGDHKRKEHDYPKLKCKAEGCESEFSVYNEYKRHEDTHRAMVECEECGKSLTDLLQHKKIVHQKARTVLQCEMADCSKKFNSISHLADHRRMVHGFAKLKCNVGECTAEFMSDAVLMKHKKSHFK